MPRYWILRGRLTVPVANLMEWAEWFETHRRECVVAQETIGSCFVSTVFLGIDHSMLASVDDIVVRGDPVLFESMVFANSNAGESKYMTRCSTWEQAEQMHRAAVQWAEMRVISGNNGKER